MSQQRISDEQLACDLQERISEPDDPDAVCKEPCSECDYSKALLDLRDARAEIKVLKEIHLRGENQRLVSAMLDMHRPNLDAQLKIAVEALKFYANHYPGIEMRDGGDKARTALDQIKGK